ncbi:MAG TPA: DUF4331 family protein [Actinomycetota bacterium]|nr:DUF4331 family protein [Actinomycetota bacterium]
MSHHFDSPTALEDGRLNLSDLYAFPGPGDTTDLILTVNPDAGRSSPTTLRPDAVYEFVIASDGGLIEDRAFRVMVEPTTDGDGQCVAVRFAKGESSRHGIDGELLGSGRTDETFALGGGGSAWFGVVSDPFWGDGFALAGFTDGLATGAYRPEAFEASPANVFDARNVTAIALRVPNASLGGDRVSLWARIRLVGHGSERQVSRMGNPMVRPLFFGQPGPHSEDLNAGEPVDDRRKHAARLRVVAENLATLRGLDGPVAHGSSVVEAFLPDVLTVRPSLPAQYEPGRGTGRGLHDDGFGIALSVLNGGPLGRSPSPLPVESAFPHLAPADHSDLPALLEMFGLRPRGQE